MKRIGLLGPYGTGNLGDAAIQQAVLYHIKKYYPTATVCGFSLVPEDTQTRHNIDAFPINPRPERFDFSSPHLLAQFGQGLTRLLDGNRGFSWAQRLMHCVLYFFVRAARELFFILKCYRTLRTFDTLLVSGGGQLDDYWGGAWGHPYTLFRWAVIAKAARTKFLVLNVGVCDINSRLSQFFTKSVLLLSDYRSFRDHYSKRVVEALGVHGDNPVFPDLAYSFPIANQFPMKRQGTLVVGISLISASAWTSDQDPAYLRYLTHLLNAAVWLIEKGYFLLFFTSQVKMDAAVTERLLANLSQHPAVSAGQFAHNQTSSVDDLLSAIAGVDLVIASRLHSVLLSHLLQKPVLALSYHKKVELLMSDMGQTDYCLSLERLDLETLTSTFTLMTVNSNSIAAQIRERVSTYRQRLEQQYASVFG